MQIRHNTDKRYTYADYLTWNDGKRWELIEGIPFEMQAAPLRIHQDLIFHLVKIIDAHLAEKDCKTYMAPFDVRLKPNLRLVKDQQDDEITTVVQPDISAFCDLKKLYERGAIGPPDLIIEIISPHSVKLDTRDKLLLYQNSGVREYWIVFPEEREVEVYSLDEQGRYSRINSYPAGGVQVISVIFPELKISVEQVFAVIG
ncbi:MAG: Uma2 family endonuclease [Bacteroidia bacterium]